MKKLFAILGIAVLLASCAGKSTEVKIEKSPYLQVNEFKSVATDSINKEMKIIGTVTHICSHSGRRCFLVDSTGNHSIRIEATGDIKTFDRELSGMDIKVTGIVRENRLTTKYIDDWEVKVKAKEENPEENGEQCTAELANIGEMRQWMKENNKDYYSILYLDGTSYEVVDKDEL